MGGPERPTKPSRRTGWAWAGATALLVLFNVPSLLRNREEGPGFALASMIGATLSLLVIGLLIRFVYVKLAARDRPVWSPWVLVIAAVLALVLAFGSAAQEIGEERSLNARDPAKLLVPLPEGFEYGRLPAAQRQYLERSLRDDVPNGEFAARSLRENGSGAMGVALGLVDSGADDLSRFEDGLEDAGGMLEPETIAGSDFLVGSNRAGLFFAVRASGEDALVMVVGLSARDVRRLAVAFAGD